MLHPLKRDPKDRGKDAWVEITWDEALDIIEERVNYIKENYGAEAIVAFQGTGREATLYKTPLAYAALGTPNSCFPMSGDSCYGPRCSVADFILGAGYPELDYAAYFPDRFDDPRYEVPKYIVLWGKDPLFSNPDGFFGHTLIDLMKRGSKFIVVDPRVTWMAAHAEYHLQLRPGTDSALGLGMINLIIQEDLYDHDFVENWCYGFDELKERAAQYPLDKVEENHVGAGGNHCAAARGRGHQPSLVVHVGPGHRHELQRRAGRPLRAHPGRHSGRLGRAGRRDAGRAPRRSWASGATNAPSSCLRE